MHNTPDDDLDMAGLESNATGVPGHIIWLFREQPGRLPFIEVTPVPRNSREDPHFDAANASVCVLYPDFMMIRGDLSDSDFRLVRAWVQANEAMIEEFWYGRLPVTAAAITQANKRITVTPDLAWG